jgi:hypothetical protein
MSETKPHLYVNSKGYLVTHHSYSGGDSFNYCARKYYLERVQGWAEKQERAAMKFGIALEAGVTFWHQRGQNALAAVAEFQRLWAEHKDKELIYSKVEKDWASLNQTGAELIQLYTLRYPNLPYVVSSPKDSFQVCEPFEVFPGTKLAGIEFTSYLDLVAQIKEGVEGVDYTKFTPGADLIIDIKTSAKDVPELTVLDPQLRSYAWVKVNPYVAFLWFRKMGRTISRGDTATTLVNTAGMAAGTDVTVMATDDFGVWVTPDERNYTAMSVTFIGEAKAVKLARQAYVEGQSHHVIESAITKQRVQFKMAVITPESQEDIGRSIKRDVINIAAANEKGFWPMQSGVRFPNEKCPMCAMRGICSENPELRDTLVTRKQIEEIDFGTESE